MRGGVGVGGRGVERWCWGRGVLRGGVGVRGGGVEGWCWCWVEGGGVGVGRRWVLRGGVGGEGGVEGGVGGKGVCWC